MSEPGRLPPHLILERAQHLVAELGDWHVADLASLASFVTGLSCARSVAHWQARGDGESQSLLEARYSWGVAMTLPKAIAATRCK